MYDVSYANLTDEEIWTWNRTQLENASTIECSSWVYDQSEFISTINSELDLVCGRSWMSQLTSTIYMSGMLFSAFLSGIMSDKIGRYITTMIGVIGNLVVSIAATFVPTYGGFVIFRFLNSFTSTIAYLGSFVLVMEVMGPTYRLSLGVVYAIFFSFGYMVDTGVALAIRDWRYFQFAISVPMLCTVLLLFMCPESPRWLIAQGRYDDAEKVFQRIADTNGRTLPKTFIKELQQSDQIAQERLRKDENSQEPKASFGDICRSSILRRELFIVYLNWFTTSLVYYGLSLNASAFGDVFLNTFLSGVIEIPANLLCLLCLEKGGRRYSNVASLLTAGVFCLACVIVLLTDASLQDLLTALSTIGKGAITFSFTCIYVYSAEMFHTPVRHLALGSSSSFARVGSMISPFIGAPLEKVWLPMPTLIFGTVSIVTGFFSILLPETKGTSLPDTLEQAEDIGRLRKKQKTYGAMDSVIVSDALGTTAIEHHDDATFVVENGYPDGAINEGYVCGDGVVENNIRL